MQTDFLERPGDVFYEAMLGIQDKLTVTDSKKTS
jgi:hypothetical protein